MREIVLVMPCETGKQQRACQDIHRELLARCGAYRSVLCDGEWRAPDGVDFPERCREIKVACEKADAEVPVAVLRRYARMAGEQAIYYVGWDGEAHVDTLTREEVSDAR